MKNVILINYILNDANFEKISIFLLKNKIISCVFLIKNIQFIYIYKGKICKTFKYKLIIKTKNIYINKILKFLYSYDNSKR